MVNASVNANRVKVPSDVEINLNQICKEAVNRYGKNAQPFAL